MANAAAMLIDVTRCMGCRACQVACKQWNQLPAEKTRFTGTYQNPPKLSATTWTLVNFIEPEDFDQNPRWLFRKQSCFHCLEATCVNVCPTGAAKKREDGIVHIDQNMCSGCKYCVETCPFLTPHFNEDSGTVTKCRMCLDRVAGGLKPACATACPTGAVSYGDRTAMLSLARQRTDAIKKDNPQSNPYLYGEKELGGLGVMYLLPENNPELYRLPTDPRLPTEKIFFRWALGIVPGLAILYGMWRHFRKDEVVTSASGGK